MAKEEDPSVNNLFQEIDDELRQDKATLLWKKYGSTLIGAIIAIIIGVGVHEGWKSYDLSTRAELGDQYAQALELARQDQYETSAKEFQTLATETDGGYKTLAMMQDASLLVQQGKNADAAQAYFKISENAEVNQDFRDLALILGALNGLDSMDATDVINRLKPLIGGANAWRHSASEITAYAYAKAGDTAKAGEIMTSLSEDASVPAGVRQRAREYAQAYAG